MKKHFRWWALAVSLGLVVAGHAARDFAESGNWIADTLMLWAGMFLVGGTRMWED